MRRSLSQKKLEILFGRFCGYPFSLDGCFRRSGPTTFVGHLLLIGVLWGSWSDPLVAQDQMTPLAETTVVGVDYLDAGALAQATGPEWVRLRDQALSLDAVSFEALIAELGAPEAPLDYHATASLLLAWQRAPELGAFLDGEIQANLEADGYLPRPYVRGMEGKQKFVLRTPPPGFGAEYERVHPCFGTLIYDQATWQVKHDAYLFSVERNWKRTDLPRYMRLVEPVPYGLSVINSDEPIAEDSLLREEFEIALFAIEQWPSAIGRAQLITKWARTYPQDSRVIPALSQAILAYDRWQLIGEGVSHEVRRKAKNQLGLIPGAPLWPTLLGIETREAYLQALALRAQLLVEMTAAGIDIAALDRDLKQSQQHIAKIQRAYFDASNLSKAEQQAALDNLEQLRGAHLGAAHWQHIGVHMDLLDQKLKRQEAALRPGAVGEDQPAGADEQQPHPQQPQQHEQQQQP